MPLDVLVSPHAVRIDLLEHTDKVVEAGIQRAKLLGTKRVRLGPVRAAAVASENSLEACEERAVGNIEAIWSGKRR